MLTSGHDSHAAHANRSTGGLGHARGGFAAAHLVHAGFFLTAMLAFGMPVDGTRLVGGGVAYLIVLGMAFTSNETLAAARSSWLLEGAGT